jgi:hypothetical protein
MFTWCASALQALLPLVAGIDHDYWTALRHHRFEHPQSLLLLPVLLCCCFLWGRRQIAILHPNLAPHKNLPSWSLLITTGYVLLALFASNLVVASAVPTVPVATVRHIVQTRDVCILPDTSGSTETVLANGAQEKADDNPQATRNQADTVQSRGIDRFLLATDPDDGPVDLNKPVRRIDAEQNAAIYLASQDMTADPFNTNRYCIIRFDMMPIMVSPLTSDRSAVVLRARYISKNVGGGTDFVVALRSAHDFFVHHSAPDAAREVVMITDGEDNIPKPKREQLVKEYVDDNINFFGIGLGDAWDSGRKLDLELFADEYRARLAEKLHVRDPPSGLIFHAANPGEMAKAVAAINSVQKAEEIVETKETERDVAYVFALVALSCVLAFGAVAIGAARVV